MTPRLPGAWLETTIDELFRTTGGGTPATGRSEFWGKGVPWITSADIDEAGEISPRKSVTLPGIASSATNPVPLGSVVVVTRVGLGKVGHAKQELCFSQDCQALLFNPELLDPSFVAHQTRRIVRGIRGRGTTIAGVTVKQLRDLPFSLAPLPEQHRIVEAIDSYLTRLDDAVVSLERVQAKLKAYRASVLKAAVEGRLVPTEASLARAEKRDYEPAGALLARILEERRRRWEEAELAKLKAAGKTSKDDKWKAKYKEPVSPNTGMLPPLPEGWCLATAAQITLRITDGEHVTPPRTEAGVLLLSARNVGNGKLILDEVDFISNETHQDLCTRLTIEPGDVLLSCSGTVGRTCVVPPGLAFSLVRSAAVLKPLIPSDYLSYALASPILQAQVHRRKKQTAQANIFQGEIAQLVFPLPPAAEQDRIVAEISRLRSVADASEQQIAADRARLLRLRQSVLKWAFSGKLVDQDPTDEPAEKLFARIRAERAAAAPMKKSRGRSAKGAA